MEVFEIQVNAMVTIHESESFIIVANSAEEAEEKAKKFFRVRMDDKHGYADYDEAEVEHLCINWEEKYE